MSAVWKISELNCFAWNPFFTVVIVTRIFTFYLVFQLLRRQWNKKPTFLLKHAHQNRFCKHICKYTAFHLPVSLIMGYFLELEHRFQPGSEAKYYRVSLPSTCQQIQTSTKSYKYKTRSMRLSHGVINSLFTVKSCRNHDLLLQNQSSNMKVSTPLFLQILTILLSTNVHSKSISISSKSC